MAGLAVAGRILACGRLVFGEISALAFGMQALLEAVDALEEGLEHVGLWASLLGRSVCGEERQSVSQVRMESGQDCVVWHTVDTRAGEDLAGLAGRTRAVAFDLWNKNQPATDDWEGGGHRKKAVPFAFGSSCSSWPLGARWQGGGSGGGRCQSVVSTW
jgi:hypothetical protein